MVLCDLGYCWLVDRALKWVDKKISEKKEKAL